MTTKVDIILLFLFMIRLFWIWFIVFSATKDSYVDDLSYLTFPNPIVLMWHKYLGVIEDFRFLYCMKTNSVVFSMNFENKTIKSTISLWCDTFRATQSTNCKMHTVYHCFFPVLILHVMIAGGSHERHPREIPVRQTTASEGEDSELPLHGQCEYDL